jgi:hypothetical protein
LALAGVGYPDLELRWSVTHDDCGIVRGGVLQGVGQGFLDDPERRQIDAEWQCPLPPFDRDAHLQPSAVELFDQLWQLGQSRLGRPGRGVGVTCGHSQYAYDPPHLRQSGAPGGLDGG